jgi:hypothetical protein
MAISRPILTRARRTTASVSIATSQDPVPGSRAPDPERDLRVHRLGEMVAGLTDRELPVAMDAVRTALDAEPGTDALGVVAAAVTILSTAEPDPFRIPGYVRPADPARRLSAMRAARRVPATATPTRGTDPAIDWDDDVTFDLRTARPRVRIDLTRRW